MSVPERKALKNILSELKAKIAISERRFIDSLERKTKLFDIALKELSKKGTELRPINQLVSRLEDSFSDFSSEALSLIEEYELYIKSLEKYSSELDKAFWQGIEKKSKEIKRQIEQQEKRIKHQEEQMKKKPKYVA